MASLVLKMSVSLDGYVAPTDGYGAGGGPAPSRPSASVHLRQSAVRWNRGPR
jgi:hypothetical protein